MRVTSSCMVFTGCNTPRTLCFVGNLKVPSVSHSGGVLGSMPPRRAQRCALSSTLAGGNRTECPLQSASISHSCRVTGSSLPRLEPSTALCLLLGWERRSPTDCPGPRICFINVSVCGKFGSSYMGKVRAKRGFHLQNNFLRFCYAVKMQHVAAARAALSSVHSGSGQFLDRLGRRGDIRDYSKEILFLSVLQKVLVSSPGMGRDVHSRMLSIQRFLCRPRRRPPSKMP